MAMLSISQIQKIADLDVRIIKAAGVLEYQLLQESPQRLSLGELVNQQPLFFGDLLRDVNFALGVRNTIAHPANGRSHTDAEKERAAGYLVRAIIMLQTKAVEDKKANAEAINAIVDVEGRSAREASTASKSKKNLFVTWAIVPVLLLCLGFIAVKVIQRPQTAKFMKPQHKEAKTSRPATDAGPAQEAFQKVVGTFGNTTPAASETATEKVAKSPAPVVPSTGVRADVAELKEKFNIMRPFRILEFSEAQARAMAGDVTGTAANNYDRFRVFVKQLHKVRGTKPSVLPTANEVNLWAHLRRAVYLYDRLSSTDKAARVALAKEGFSFKAEPTIFDYASALKSLSKENGWLADPQSAEAIAAFNAVVATWTPGR